MRNDTVTSGAGRPKQTGHRRCANCWARTAHIFCKMCFKFVDGGVKGRFRELLRLGSPTQAVRLVREELDTLRRGGVPVPVRPERVESEVES